MFQNQKFAEYFGQFGQVIWLLVVPAALLFMLYGVSMRKRALRFFASSNLIGFLAPQMSVRRRYVKAGLITLSLLAIVVALTAPRWGSFQQEAQQRQLDLMICLDVSKSMLAQDAGMSRLDRAKDDIARLLRKLAGGTIGLVTFAGRADLTSPLTDDFEFYRMVLDEVGIHSAPVGGTNLGSAIKNARLAFDDLRTRDKVIVLITDGEDHGGSAIEQARLANEAGIIVHAIGIGDDTKGGLVPVTKDGQSTFQTHQGRQVWSKLDPAALQAIARAGGGEYHESGQVTNRLRTLEWLYTEKIAAAREREATGEKIEQKHERFHWFAIAGLVLLMIETLVRERRSARALEAVDTVGTSS